MQELQKVYCPSCGAPIKFLEGRDDTFCTHCGHQIFKEDTMLEKKMEHEENIMEMMYKEKKEARENEQHNWILVFTFAMFVLVFGALIFMGTH